MKAGPHSAVIARLAKELEVAGSIPGLAHTFTDINHEIFPVIISPLPLI